MQFGVSNVQLYFMVCSYTVAVGSGRNLRSLLQQRIVISLGFGTSRHILLVFFHYLNPMKIFRGVFD